ncbi:hypothetical protein ABK040_015831 [Willaertia magna]
MSTSPYGTNHVKNCLVVGGAGFLGQHLVEDLLALGYNVAIFDINGNSELNNKVKLYTGRENGDICSKEAVLSALKDFKVDTIFHTATPNPFASPEILRKVNVDGTKNLLDCAIEIDHVKNFILVSSASVVFDGTDTNNCNEEKPYAKKGVNTYTLTKIEQEKLTLEYGKKHSDKIRTVAIRPASIFGERDLLFFPIVVENGKKGRTKFYVGNGKNYMDYTYVKNVTHCLILAATHLDKESVTGEAFFVTNQEPELFWGFMADILKGFDLPTPKIGIPVEVMYCISYIMLFISLMLGLCGIKFAVPPQFELDKNALLVVDRRFDSSKATRLLNYKPLYNMAESKKRAIEYFKEEEKKKQANKKKD